MYFKGNKSKQKQVSTGILAALVLYATVVFYLMFVAANRAKELSAGSTDVVFGPLALVHIEKTALAGGGFSLEFGMRAGMLVLLAVAVGLGGLFGFLYASKRQS